MPWQCRLVAADKSPKEIGDMWEEDIYRDDGKGCYFSAQGRLSDEYVTQRMAQRKPLAVMLPGGRYGWPFGIDTSITDQTRGWQVTGVAPNITVSPSINVIGVDHGWLRDGVISDDCEGRRF